MPIPIQSCELDLTGMNLSQLKQKEVDLIRASAIHWRNANLHQDIPDKVVAHVNVINQQITQVRQRIKEVELGSTP